MDTLVQRMKEEANQSLFSKSTRRVSPSLVIEWELPLRLLRIETRLPCPEQRISSWCNQFYGTEPYIEVKANLPDTREFLPVEKWERVADMFKRIQNDCH